MVTSPFRISVGTTAVRVVPSDKKRTALGIANLHSTAVLYYSTDPNVTTANGFPIHPKSIRDLNIGLGDNPKTEFFVISDTAATDVAVSEQYGPE